MSQIKPQDILPDQAAYSRWAFDLQGRVPFNWGMSAHHLLRAAARSTGATKRRGTCARRRSRRARKRGSSRGRGPARD